MTAIAPPHAEPPALHDAMTPLRHHLRPLLTPASVALVGASGRPGSVGRVVLENLLDGGFNGDLHFVNPRHRRVLGKRCHASLQAIGKPIELALIAVPCAAVPGVLDDGARAGVRAAVLLSAPPGDKGDAQRWQRDLIATAKKRRIRLLGPHAFGVIRTDIGLNATLGAAIAHPGRLALIAQSSAVCTAMLDFATPFGIGFSTVVALGGACDVDFGELLDALLRDPGTDGILLYVETVRDARGFLSALRAAARTKPVVVLRAGRSMERGMVEADAPQPDAVFDAAMKRAGAVRVMTYTQLFAAARILAMGRIPHRDHLAIVTNGHGPGTLAADSAADRGVALAVLSSETEAALATILPPHLPCTNPVNVRGDATPERLAAAIAATLADPGVDAVLALHVQRPLIAPTDAARAVAAVARGASKPVLGAWLGAIERHEVRAALEAGGIPNFYTPENAVEAFSFLTAYRRNQAWLLEVPPPQPEPRPLDLAMIERIRDEAAAANRTVLTDLQTHRLLAAFGLPVLPAEAADTLKEALTIARKLGYPITLKLDAAGLPVKSPLPVARTNLRDGRMLTRAYGEMQEGVRRAFVRDDVHAGVIVRKELRLPDSRDVAIGVHTDAVFGPVITFGHGGAAALADSERAVLLPPLNRRLALEAISGTRAAASLPAGREAASPFEPLVSVLLQVSCLVCALPWVRSLMLDPVRVAESGTVIAGACVVIDPKRRFAATGYRHMAIHPYPIEMVADVSLEDGTVLHVRPIRPEDAELERAFVNGLSEQTRYFRFFYRLHELTPAMLARFTQIDYDREVALVAIDAPGDTAARAGEQRREPGSRGPKRDAQGDATGANSGMRGDEGERASGEQGPLAEGTGMRAGASAQGIGAIANRRSEADTQRGAFPEVKRALGRYEADAGRGARHHEHEEAEAAFVGVARYIANPDQESAEFAVVVADAWQRRGVARMLMQRLIACARLRGLARLEGTVLRENTNMRKFTEALGFVTHDDVQEPEQVTVVLDLT